MTPKATRAFLRRVCLLTSILACISSFFLAHPQLYRLAEVDFITVQAPPCSWPGEAIPFWKLS